MGDRDPGRRRADREVIQGLGYPIRHCERSEAIQPEEGVALKLDFVLSRIGALATAFVIASVGIYVGALFLWEHPHFILELISGHVEQVVLERQRLHFPTGITDGSFGVPETAVAWNADGSRLATLGKTRATIWDTKSWTKLKEISVFEPQRISGRSIAFLPDDSLLVPASRLPAHRPEIPNHEALKAWNLQTGNLVRTYPDVERSEPDLVATIKNSHDRFEVSQDGKLIVGISFDGLYLYGAATGALLRQWTAPAVPGPPQQPGFPEPARQSRDGFLAVAISPGGTEIAVCGFSGRVYLLGAADVQLRHTIVAFEEGRNCTALTYSSDGKFLAAGGGIRSLFPGEKQQDVRNESSVRVWRVGNGSLLASLTGMIGRVRTLAWRISENILAAGDDGSVRLWRIDDNEQPMIFYRHIGAGVMRMAFSARGQLACAEERGFDVVIYQ